MKFVVGQWVAYETIARDRSCVGKVVEATPDKIVVEVHERGEVRRVTFDSESPWWPSRIRWKLVRGRRSWEYV